MNFAMTEEHLMIQASAAALLAQASDSAAIRAAAQTDIGFDTSLWQRMGQEMGWCATAIPDEFGGMGLGVVEESLLMEQMGRRLACSPFFSTVCLAATFLIESGSAMAQSRWLPDIAAGTLNLTVALKINDAGNAHDNLVDTDARASRTESGWKLDGHFDHVHDGISAQYILVIARIDQGDELGVFVVPADALGVTRIARLAWDTTRRLASVTLTGVTVSEAGRIDRGFSTSEGLERAAAISSILLAAEQLGGAQQCLEITLAYTQERTQFGQPVAAFQAVKHRCAQMMVGIEAARSAVYGAAAVADSTPTLRELLLEAGMAKSLAGEAFFFCAQEAIQLHGGVGFTWEYAPHLYFKRAQASNHWLGSPDRWRARIAHLLLD